QSGAEGFSRTVAVKLVLPGFSTVPQFASMFVEEAKLASLLDHPNIVSVSDFDRDEEGRLFLVMEYVDGRDLASVAASGRLPFWATIFVITEVLRGLGYAHELPTAAGPRGVIHRDVSPHNVLLSWEGAVKVSDFGIAKARDASVATASTMIKGKPAYMSPEQASGEALDGRSDLFAVGIMMWELLTGRRLFDGSTQETLTRVIAGQVPPPSSVCADVPRDLDAITMRFLARDRDKRYPRAEAAIVDLSHCVDAPRNGRSDFAKLLADRFPAAIAQRSSRSPTTSEPARKPPVADKDQVGEPSTRRDVAPQQRTKPWAPSTTLGSAASEAVRSRRVSRRGSVLLASFAVIAGTAGLVGGYRLLRSGSGDVAKNAAIPAPTRNEARAITTDGTRDLDAATTLTIDTAPPGGSVIVDGVYRGQAPVTISANVGQRLDIEASRAGYVTETTTVPVARLAQTVVVALRAKPTPLVNAAPANPEASSVPKPAKPGKRSSAKTRQSTSGSGTFNPDDAMD
ncbi:MAG TPA: serine/threonine-protein kinase, partial [Kofleriaceae bacterium]|nr:serine/threonine-protein kinase [Kofleriaceae bacterium]